MTTTLSFLHNLDAVTPAEQSRRRSANLRTTVLFALAAILGAVGWSGVRVLNCVALLYPFVYLHSQRRLDSLSAAFYYAAATWSVVPAAQQFFGPGQSRLQPLLLWLALILLSSAPWVTFYNRRLLPISALAALACLSVPPLGLITLVHPLIATGIWFPGTRWFGLALPSFLLGVYRRIGTRTTLAILLVASAVVHVRSHRSVAAPNIVSLNTSFGGTYNSVTKLESEPTELALQRIALSHPNSLVLLPESVLPGWNPTHEARWAGTFSQLKQQHTGVLIGTTIPIPNTEANRNVLLSRGYTEQLSYVQRVPVPLGMWHFGDKHRGFPLMLGYPATIRIWNQRAGVLICYEQLLVWPALQSLARNPDMLLAPSNLYWAQGTPVPKIQHIAAQDWADLWGIPLYKATNQ